MLPAAAAATAVDGGVVVNAVAGGLGLRVEGFGFRVQGISPKTLSLLPNPPSTPLTLPASAAAAVLTNPPVTAPPVTPPITPPVSPPLLPPPSSPLLPCPPVTVPPSYHRPCYRAPPPLPGSVMSWMELRRLSFLQGLTLLRSR